MPPLREGVHIRISGPDMDGTHLGIVIIFDTEICGLLTGLKSTHDCVMMTETGKLDCSAAGSWRCFPSGGADGILACSFGWPGSSEFVGAFAVSQPRSGIGPLVLDPLPFKPLLFTLDTLAPLVRVFLKPASDLCYFVSHLDRFASRPCGILDEQSGAVLSLHF